MAEQFLYSAEVGSTVQKMSCETMPQAMYFETGALIQQAQELPDEVLHTAG